VQWFLAVDTLRSWLRTETPWTKAENGGCGTRDVAVSALHGFCVPFSRSILDSSRVDFPSASLDRRDIDSESKLLDGPFGNRVRNRGHGRRRLRSAQTPASFSPFC
jgi:hypothetical protein